MPSLARPKRHYVLVLYVAGATPAALRSVDRVRSLSEAELGGDVDLRVVDISKDFEQAASNDIVATPTLVRLLPGPVRHLVGELLADELLVGITVDLDDSTSPP